MKTIKTLMVVACGLAVSGNAFALEPIEADFGADLVSTYIWRGQKLDDAALQPSLTVGCGGLSLDAWGSVGVVQGDYKEFDLALSYEIGGFSVVATDYFCADSNTGYFDYSEDTPHTFELGLSYDFGFMSLSWFSNVLGATGCNEDGDNVMASYFEVAAPFEFGGLDWSAALGASPFENDFYGTSGFGIVNCSLTASKDLTIGSAKLPVFAQIMANPRAERVFFAVGVSF